MITNWGEKDKRDFTAECSPKYLRKLDMAGRKKLLFDAIRARATAGVQELLKYEPVLGTEVMYGYEGSDVHAETENTRCYHYTAIEKDGFFYPLHVAAESGAREVVTILLKDYDADMELLDYKDDKAESKSTSESQKSFYEARGLHFEAAERYTGSLHHITGNRHGAGTLFYKPEGYESVEKVLYRGTFKDNVYHGQGALFWPGSDVMQYKGRFKASEKHGRGVLFDSRGNKIYHGTFRNGKKDGRGELFEEIEGTFTRTYHGEFENDQMHGFGVASYGSGGTFVGRFEYGLKAGVGIYSYPNGDRFEGMFFGDKPDGKGSYYVPTANGKEIGTHHIWQNGRKANQVDTPFVPDKLDMPEANDDDINSNSMLSAILNNASDDASISSTDTRGRNNLSSTVNKEFRDDTNAVGTAKGGDKPGLSDPTGKDWKQQLGSAVRIGAKTAELLGIKSAEIANIPSKKIEGKVGPDGEDLDDEEEGEGEEEEEPDMDDVISSHFLKYAPLLTAYVYSCSASKVFEGRSAPETDGAPPGQAAMPMTVPDFDLVNHLVMDAVEEYNERWEKAYALQKKEEDEAAEIKKAEDGAEKKEDSKHGYGIHDSVAEARVVSQIKQKNVFMTEAEKRKELKRKQRAELAAKKGGTLAKEIEDHIGQIVYENLEMELCELTTDNGSMDDMDGLLPTRSWQALQRNRKHEDKDIHARTDEDERRNVVSNEFAIELLYLLRIAKSVT